MYACIAGPVFGRSIIPVSPPQPHRKNTCSAFLLCTGPGTCIIPTILLHRIEDCGIHKLCAFATEVEFSPRQRIPAFRFLVAGSCYPTPGFWLLAPSSHSPEIPGMPLTHSQKAQNRLNYCYKLPLPSGNSNNRRQKVEGSRRRAKGQRANRLSFWPRFALSAS